MLGKRKAINQNSNITYGNCVMQREWQIDVDGADVFGKSIYY